LVGNAILKRERKNNYDWLTLYPVRSLRRMCQHDLSTIVPQEQQLPKTCNLYNLTPTSSQLCQSEELFVKFSKIALD
jgi:hypothetical protein